MSKRRTRPATRGNFDEAAYLAANPDVVTAIAANSFASGAEHFELYGQYEQRRIVETENQKLVGLLPNQVRLWLDRIRGNDAIRRLDRADERIRELEVFVRQQEAMLRCYHEMETPPPKHLQVRVVGHYTSKFIESGFDEIVPTLNDTLGEHGIEMSECQSILDFGTGCGRALVALSKSCPNSQLHGTDIDAEAIQWCASHYGNIAKFTVAPHVPPLDYDDQSFDFVFGISVMTHLPEEMHLKWLAELHRITAPGGTVLLTTNGSNHHDKLPPLERQRLDSEGFIYIDSGYGQQISLPDFYQTTMHTHEYIERRWADLFEVAQIKPRAYGGYQDIVVLRRLK